jgi:zinc/manganese transport system substrate-binding protein
VKKLILSALLVLLPVVAQAKLNVVATTPDLAAVAREIGGDRIEVKALAKATEDPHFVDAKPSLIVTLNRADVLIEGGAELELGWLPTLLESARNDKIAAGAPGRIVASQGVKMLEVPVTFDRSQGDIHSRGNPHFLLDPVNVRIVGSQLAERFAQLDPSSADAFRANHAKFESTLAAKLVDWQKQLEPFRGAAIVTYHKDFSYLAERFQLEVVETLEAKPGIPPSPAHLVAVIETMKARGARVILVQPYQDRRTAETVARETGATILDFPQQPGAVKDTATYFQLMDHLVQTLATALREAK